MIGFHPGSGNIPSPQVVQPDEQHLLGLLGKWQGIIRDDWGDFLHYKSMGKVLKLFPFSRIQILDQSEINTESRDKIWRTIIPLHRTSLALPRT